MKPPCINANAPATPVTADLVVRQAALEAKLWGTDSSTIAVSVSVWKSFFRLNGFGSEALVSLSFLCGVEHALDHERKSDVLITWPASGNNPSSVNSRLRDLMRAGKSLFEPSFAEVLRAHLKASGCTYSEVAKQAGVDLGKLYTWLVFSQRFVGDMTVDQAKQLDIVLRGERRFFSVFAAMSQLSVFTPMKSAREAILGEDSFGTMLRQLRIRSGLNTREVLRQVLSLTTIEVDSARLHMWEQGIGHPCEDAKPIIHALDQIYAAQGALISKWQAGNPRASRTEYSLEKEKWPKRTQDQFDQLERSQANRRLRRPESYLARELPSGKKILRGWSSEASVELFQAFCEGYLGYLDAEKIIARSDLSLTLLCDWHLVISYFDFVRVRSGRKLHGVHQRNIARELLSLYRPFMPSLVNDAASETHWAKLSSESPEDESIAPGVTRTKILKFNSFKEAWVRHLELTWREAKHFDRRTRFAPSSYVGKSQALLDIAATVEQISDAVAAIFALMPIRILCRKSAILSRRLAVAALLVARVLRPGTIRKLKVSWVKVVNGVVRVRIPEEAFKQYGLGGSKAGINGKLPPIPWVHSALKLWIEQGRPFMVREGGGNDLGFFLTGAHQTRRLGAKLSASGLDADALIVLGYSPYEHRYLFSTDAALHGVAPEDTGNTMQNTAGLAVRYNKGTPIAKAKFAKTLIERLASAA